MTEPTIITTEPERRQLGKCVEFSPLHAQYIDWNGIALTAKLLGSHFEARFDNEGGCVVVMYWAVADEVDDAPPL